MAKKKTAVDGVTAPVAKAPALPKYDPDALSQKDLFNINDWLGGPGDLYATNVGTAESAYGRGLGGSGGMNTLGALRQDAYFTGRHKLGNEALRAYLDRNEKGRENTERITAETANTKSKIDAGVSIANMANATANRQIDGQIAQYARGMMNKANQLNSRAGVQTGSSYNGGNIWGGGGGGGGGGGDSPIFGETTASTGNGGYNGIYYPDVLSPPSNAPVFGGYGVSYDNSVGNTYEPETGNYSNYGVSYDNSGGGGDGGDDGGFYNYGVSY